MERYLKKLGPILDGWAKEKRAVLTETTAMVVVGGLSGEDALTLVGTAEESAGALSIEDATETVVRPEDITEDFAPFKISIAKPDVPPNVGAVLTNAALADWLTRAPERTVLWCAGLQNAFETYSVRFAPWGDETPFTSMSSVANARKVVREASGLAQVPGDLGPWLLRDGTMVPLDEAPANVWANLSSVVLFRSLTSEVEADGALRFRGPPVVRYSMSSPAMDFLSPSGLAAMHAAARWVFESERDVETRHGLLTAELARTNVASSEAAILFDKGAAPALEGARIAHQLGLHKLSLDSLKAMADLRKAVTDETAKLSDSTRQLAGAVASALFAGTGIIAARLTMTITGPVVASAILILGLVLCAYVAAVIISGFQFVAIQRDLRLQWRERLYRYLPDTEYEAMVSRPARRAEVGFTVAAVISGILAVLLMASVLAVTFAPMPLGSATTNTKAP